MGLPDKAIKNIVALEGKGILFVCLSCRINNPSPSSSRRTSDIGSDQMLAIKQLHEMVTSLCLVVRSLMSSILPQAHSQSQPVCSIATSEELDMRIREQIREVRDREIRRDSVIVRGLPDTDVNTVCSLFKDSQLLINKEVSLQDPVCIDREKGIFRGKVTNMEDKKSLLAASRKLKQTARFSLIYVHRDLTYRQRQNLRARREAANGGRASAGESRSSEAPPAGTLSSFLPP